MAAASSALRLGVYKHYKGGKYIVMGQASNVGGKLIGKTAQLYAIPTSGRIRQPAAWRLRQPGSCVRACRTGPTAVAFCTGCRHIMLGEVINASNDENARGDTWAVYAAAIDTLVWYIRPVPEFLENGRFVKDDSSAAPSHSSV